MSYEIYKSIKQNVDGSFDCVCASSNVFDQNDKYVFTNFHMTYFNDTFPNATNEEKRACWLLYSLYVGDVFYPTAWKKNQTLANKFMMEHNYDYQVFYHDKDKWLEYAKEFVKYMKEQSSMIRKYRVLINNMFVVKKTKSHVKTSLYCNDAKIFNDTLEDLKEMFSGYAKYNPQFVEVVND